MTHNSVSLSPVFLHPQAFDEWSQRFLEQVDRMRRKLPSLFALLAFFTMAVNGGLYVFDIYTGNQQYYCEPCRVYEADKSALTFLSLLSRYMQMSSW